MLWPKKTHTRNLITKKNSCGSKIPSPPHNFSNGPSLISKLVETVVAKQLQHYLNCNNLFPVFQSAYRKSHSTETALLKVMNDILSNMNNQCVTLLILLDLSVAFYTVNHDTMLRRLEYSFGIQGKALSWFSSYLSGRTQRIMINGSLSKSFKLECGVP